MGNKKHRFTEEQAEILRQNVYTASVVPSQISFTKEFKALFYEKHNNGMTTMQILIECGYDPDMLGHDRVKSLAYHINEQMEKYGQFYEGHNIPKCAVEQAVAKKLGLTTEEKVKQLEHEVNYLRQELEFLKKISSIRNTRK